MFASAVALTLPTSAAFANSGTCKDNGATARWVPQRSWPTACEPDAVTDGLVLLDGDALPFGTSGGEGQLAIKLQRMVQGQPVETFEGKVTRPDATSALFQSDRPLPPHADYQITAVHESLEGEPMDAPFTSAFTTGERALAPLTFAGDPAVTYEELDGERWECTVDGCGKKNCQPGDDTVHLKQLRVAVPAIQGGVDLKPFDVTAKLVATFADGQAPAVATSDTAATQAGHRSFLVVELPALPTGAQGCVTIDVSDAAGHTLTSQPVCTALPADEQPYDDDQPGLPVLRELGLTQTVDDATATDDVQTQVNVQSTTTMAAASAQGCAVGGMGGSGWALVLLGVAAGRRKRAA